MTSLIVRTSPLITSAVVTLGYALLGSLVDFYPATMLTYLAVVFILFCFAEKLYLPMVTAPIGIALAVYLMQHIDRTVDGQFYEFLIYEDYGYLIDYITESFWIDYNSREAFLLFLSPFVSDTYGYVDLQYLAVNSLLLLLTLLFFTRYIRHLTAALQLPELAPTVSNIAIALLVLSPTLLFVLPELMKDLPSVFLTIAAATMVLDKRYLPALAFVLFGTVIRSYAPILVAIYVLVAKPRDITDYGFALLITLANAAFMHFNPSALVNSLIAIPYICISPNPLNDTNWDWPMGIATSEGVFLSSAFIICLYLIASTDERRRGADRIALGLFLYAMLLVAVGYTVRTSLEGGDYAVGTSGDNFFRKKLPAIPILYTIIGYAVARLRHAAVSNQASS